MDTMMTQADYDLTIKQWWDRVASIGCIITKRPATIHHIHSGSCADIGAVRGVSQRGVSDWLVIPIEADLHTGKWGIDSGMGVRTWEERFGLQIHFMDEVCRRTGINAWAMAAIVRNPWA